MRAAREAAREASAAAAATAAASVAASAAEAVADNSAVTAVAKTEGIKGRSGVGFGDGLGRDERKRKREAAGSSGIRFEAGAGHLKREDVGAEVVAADAGSDDEVKAAARGGEVASIVSHQRGGGHDDADVRFVGLSEEKAAGLDAQVIM